MLTGVKHAITVHDDIDKLSHSEYGWSGHRVVDDKPLVVKTLTSLSQKPQLSRVQSRWSVNAWWLGAGCRAYPCEH